MKRPIGRRLALIVTGVTLALLSLLALPACCCRTVTSPRPVAQPPPVSSVGYADFDVPREAITAKATEAEMKNVLFRLDPDLVLNIHSLRGQMESKESGAPLNFDDPRSFVMRLFSARVGLDGRSLTQLMNTYAFGYEGAPIRDLTVTMAGRQLRQEGIMHKIIDIPFSMLADVSVELDGRIRIHPTEIEICSLDGKALMKAFGMSLEKVLDLRGATGVQVEKNDLLIDALKVLPPPAIEGHLESVAIEGDEMVQTFRSDHPSAPLDVALPDEPNYMFFEGGTLRMGKLFMVRADMQVVDTDPTDPFDFFLLHYNNQLVAGHTSNQPDYGLVVYMRDFADLGRPTRPGERR